MTRIGAAVAIAAGLEFLSAAGAQAQGTVDLAMRGGAPSEQQLRAPRPRLAPRETVLRASLRVWPVTPVGAARPHVDAQAPGHIPGLLRSTVGFVVPLPGTEMIRVGVVQEGATLQAANRAPSLEGLGKEGAAKVGKATITIIVRKPGG